MTKSAVKEKIVNLEAELELLKKAVEQRPGFEIDEENWQKIKSEARKERTKLYKKSYGRK